VALTSNHIYFFISYAVAFIAFGVTAYLYLWPAIAVRGSPGDLPVSAAEVTAAAPVSACTICPAI
jgi:hypothetical protein